MTLENLIFVNGFAANQFILKNLLILFKEFYNVYLIDLPGFCNNNKIKQVDLEGITSYVDKEIKKLNIKNYIIMGLSLGHLVISKSDAVKKAKGILAVYPYLNAENLNLSKLQININIAIVKIILKTSAYNVAWNSGFVKKLMQLNKYNKRIINSIINNSDPKLFFETAYLLLTYNKKPKFYKKPYVLIINYDDELINTKKIIPIFKENINKLLVIKSNIPHTPKKLTKSYFQKSFTKQKIQKIQNFLKKNA